MGSAEDSFAAYVLDQLGALRGLGCRAMFGGHGLYLGPTFFGIIHGGRLYFRTGDATRGDYVRRGMRPFAPNDRQLLKTYYEVPADVVEDRQRLAAWARAAADSADSDSAGARRAPDTPAAAARRLG